MIDGSRVVLGVVILGFSFTMITLLILRRNIFPVKNRVPSLLILHYVWLIILGILVIVQANSISCQMVIWIRWLNIPILVFIITTRYINVMASENIQEELLSDTSPQDLTWVLKVSIWFTKIPILFGMVIASVAVLIFFVLLPITIKARELINGFDDPCNGDEFIARALIITNLVTSVPAVIIICFLWRLKEAVYIKTEIRLLTAGFLVLFSHHILALIYQVELSTFFAIYQGVIIFVNSMFTLASPLLIWSSYREERKQYMKDSGRSRKNKRVDITMKEDDSSKNSITVSSSDLEASAGTTGSVLEILNDDIARDKFKQFLSLEFCAENVRFFEAVKEFKGSREEDRIVLAKYV